MNINERNRKVALSRWNRIHEKEKIIVNKNSHKFHLKARLFGFLAGDGSVMIRKDNSNNLHYVLRFFPDHESLIEPFTESLSEIYNKKPIIKKDYKNYTLICYSKVVVQDLLNTAKFGTQKWEIPIGILKDKKSKIEWLKAFFDSEGYVGKNHIKIQTVNKNGMDQLKKLLSEFGINSRRYVYHPKHKNWNDVHILIIGTKAEQWKFLNIIGFNHRIKLYKLRKMLGSPNQVWH